MIGRSACTHMHGEQVQSRDAGSALSRRVLLVRRRCRAQSANGSRAVWRAAGPSIYFGTARQDALPNFVGIHGAAAAADRPISISCAWPCMVRERDKYGVAASALDRRVRARVAKSLKFWQGSRRSPRFSVDRHGWSDDLIILPVVAAATGPVLDRFWSTLLHCVSCLCVAVTSLLLQFTAGASLHLCLELALRDAGGRRRRVHVVDAKGGVRFMVFEGRLRERVAIKFCSSSISFGDLVAGCGTKHLATRRP